MTTVDRRCGHRITGTALAVLISIGFSATFDPVNGQELPALRKGLWEFQRTVDKQKSDIKKCASPSEDMKRQNAMLEKSGCTFSPTKKSGNTYRFTADCAMKTPSGGTINAHSTSVVTVDSDNAYTVEVDGTMNGQLTKERLVARRIGDCAN